MSITSGFRFVFSAGGLCAVALLAACGDTPTVVGPDETSARSSISSMLTAADVVVAGADGGAFVNGINANNSGYVTTEFWDNLSGDGGVNCNAGFYAVGNHSPECGFDAPGSDANQGGYVGGKYWGDGPTNRSASSFMFSGNYTYVVRLLGVYAAAVSEVGWFTENGGVYDFRPVAGWGSKTVGSVALINPPAGQNWGLYFKRADIIAGTGCSLDNKKCSDATGDVNGGVPPVQQFSLFTNSDESKFLVGVEDNSQVVFGLGDDDFNDYLLEVIPVAVSGFVIGDVQPHGVGDHAYFWGSQWWKNNFMSGSVSNGVAAFKGYANERDNYCGGTWSSRPGNSSNPPARIPQNVLVIVTNTVIKSGPAISGNIVKLVMVDQDGTYGSNPGHSGEGQITQIVCDSPIP